MTSPSRIVVRALGLVPEGTPTRSASTCVLCGCTIAVGELSAPFRPGANFTDESTLAERGRRPGVTCGDCVALGTKTAMFQSQAGVFTERGAFNIRRLGWRGHFLLHPPEPPFVAVLSDAKLQHLVWRTPITRSRDYLHVRFGNRLLTIRRPVLLEAHALLQEFAQRVAKSQSEAAPTPPKSKKKSAAATPTRPARPFRMDLMLIEAQAWRFNALAFSHLSDIERASLAQLTQGELWALATLYYSIPEVPPLISSSNS